jgi:hypothetical protein
VVPLVALHAAAVAHKRGQSILQTLRHRWLPLLIPWLLLVAGVTLWRLGFYGALIPNSVTAKALPPFDAKLLLEKAGPGLRYYRSFVETALPLAYGALVAPLVAPGQPAVWLCLAVIAVQVRPCRRTAATGCPTIDSWPCTRRSWRYCSVWGSAA